MNFCITAGFAGRNGRPPAVRPQTCRRRGPHSRPGSRNRVPGRPASCRSRRSLPRRWARDLLSEVTRGACAAVSRLPLKKVGACRQSRERARCHDDVLALGGGTLTARPAPNPGSLPCAASLRQIRAAQRRPMLARPRSPLRATYPERRSRGFPAPGAVVDDQRRRLQTYRFAGYKMHLAKWKRNGWHARRARSLCLASRIPLTLMSPPATAREERPAFSQGMFENIFLAMAKRLYYFLCVIDPTETAAAPYNTTFKTRIPFAFRRDPLIAHEAEQLHRPHQAR